jgi:hypothetical protein
MRLRLQWKPTANASVTIERAPQELFELLMDPNVSASLLLHWHSQHGADARTPGPVLTLVSQSAPRRIDWSARLANGVCRVSASMRAAPGGRGSELRVEITQQHAAPSPSLLREDLRNFKHRVETGEYPTTKGQPNGRRSMGGRALTAWLAERLQRELWIGDAVLFAPRARPGASGGSTR